MRLPFVTSDFPGTGGRLKAEPAHFQVEEIPLYQPAGEGEHVYLRLVREGLTTRELTRRLARLFHLKDVDVGAAGLKDRHARAVQTISLRLPAESPDAAARRVSEELEGVEVLDAARHRNKLRRGHLVGNRFRVLVNDPVPGAPARAREVEAALHERGMANFYGAQRFGSDGSNAEQGLRILRRDGGRRGGWVTRLQLSAYQSHLFNRWLARRMERGLFDRLLGGDVAKKLDTGGLFDVEDEAAEMERFARHEITYTGPIYGARMRRAGGEAGAMEEDVLREEGIGLELFARARLEGSRRPGRIFPGDLHIAERPEGLEFTFTLPKGSYATVLLAEFMKAGEEPPTAETGVSPDDRTLFALPELEEE